jgi:hypothetical protein
MAQWRRHTGKTQLSILRIVIFFIVKYPYSAHTAHGFLALGYTYDFLGDLLVKGKEK